MSDDISPTALLGYPAEGIPDQIGEQLSALMDGELARDQVRFLLRSVEAESDLVRRWSNYQVISATLKREHVSFDLPADFADSILGRLDLEAVAMPSSSRRRGVTALRWVGGGAIAAAVAVVALVVSRPVGDNGVQVTAARNPDGAQQAALAREAYPRPFQPQWHAPLPGFNADNVMPASLDSVLPSYYTPRGETVWRNEMPVRLPYLLQVTKVPRPLEPAAMAPQQATSP